MVIRQHKYKVINEQGAVYVTHADAASARQFLQNASNRIDGLRVEENTPNIKGG